MALFPAPGAPWGFFQPPHFKPCCQDAQRRCSDSERQGCSGGPVSRSGCPIPSEPPPPPPPGSDLSLLSESAHLITAPPYEMLLSLPHVHLGKLRHGRDSTCPRSRYHQHLDLDTPHFTTRGSLQGSSPLSSWSGGWALPLGDQLERQPVP